MQREFLIACKMVKHWRTPHAYADIQMYINVQACGLRMQLTGMLSLGRWVAVKQCHSIKYVPVMLTHVVWPHSNIVLFVCSLLGVPGSCYRWESAYNVPYGLPASCAFGPYRCDSLAGQHP